MSVKDETSFPLALTVPKRGGRKSAGSEKGSGIPNVQIVPIEYAGMSAEQLRLHIRDGRVCLIFKERDTDPDPVFPHEPIYWFRGPKGYKPQGDCCHYCMKVYLNIFSLQISSSRPPSCSLRLQPHTLPQAEATHSCFGRV